MPLCMFACMAQSCVRRDCLLRVCVQNTKAMHVSMCRFVCDVHGTRLSA